MKLKSLIVVFCVLWLVSAAGVLVSDDIEWFGSLGDSFGAVNALFSGIALALAVYSMILQQRQNAEFEQKTLMSLVQQSEAIDLIKSSLVQQANAARIHALTYSIERYERTVEDLKDWGRKGHDNENHYSNGIKAAQARINKYQKEVDKVAADSTLGQH